MQGNWLHDLATDSLGDFEVSDELDQRLSRLAIQSRSDEGKAFELFGLLAYKIERFVRRFRSWELHPFDLDDIVQESYLVFIDTLHRWVPHYVDGLLGGYLYYFLKVFPLWLANRVRGWKRITRQPIVRTIRTREAATTQDAANVDGFCRNLSLQDSTLVELRVLRGHSIPRAARTMGIARRTAYRRWHRILEMGREYLREAG